MFLEEKSFYTTFIPVLLVASIGSYINIKMRKRGDNIYDKNIDKGLPNPIIFMIVWPILYFLIAISTYLSLRDNTDSSSVRNIYLTFYIQLAINMAWSFFGFVNPIISTVLILCMIIVSLFQLYFMYQAVKESESSLTKYSYTMFIPYIVWLCFATYLSWKVM